MNGYGSHCKPKSPMMFSEIQTITKTVIQTRNWGVPINRANFSAKLPKASVSSRGILNPRRTRGWSRRSVMVFPPVGRQQVVEQIVDGHGAHESVVLVHHRHRDEVIRRHAARD